MKKIYCLILFSIFFFSFSATAQILSPIASLTTSIDGETQGFFIGKTTIDGVFQGFKMDILHDTPLVYEMDVIPLFGYTAIKAIDSIKIIQIDSNFFESLQDIENISNLDGKNFTNVDIIAENGPFLLSSNTGRVEIQSELPYAIGSFMNQPIQTNTLYEFFIIATNSGLTSQFFGDISYLTSYEDNHNQRIQIKNKEGSVLWSDTAADYLFVIEDEEFTFYQQSSLYLLPLPTNQNREKIRISITPSNIIQHDMSSILENVSATSENIDIISDISEHIKLFQPFITTLSPILDGGLILLNTKDTVRIDGAVKSFSQFCFARGDDYEITISNQTQTPVISGDFRLIFLGDHMYTSQAKQSEIGISFPLFIFIFWIIALSLFILFRFCPKPTSSPVFKNINEQTSEKIRKYGFLFHIIAIISVFILIDREISFQFGMSVFGELFSLNFSLILLTFLGIQLLLWIIGFFALALPIKILLNSVFQYLGFDKSTKSIGKGVGLFGIWIFTALYVKLIINLLLLIVNPAGLFTMG
jgi:hypothetical protein